MQRRSPHAEQESPTSLSAAARQAVDGYYASLTYRHYVATATRFALSFFFSSKAR